MHGPKLTLDCMRSTSAAKETFHQLNWVLTASCRSSQARELTTFEFPYLQMVCLACIASNVYMLDHKYTCSSGITFT
jgi:hypothetical protein